MWRRLFGRKKPEAANVMLIGVGQSDGQATPSADREEPCLGVDKTTPQEQGANKPERSKKYPDSFDQLPQAYGLRDAGKNEFAEIFGGAKVESTRLFIIAVLALLLGVGGVGWALNVAGKKTAIPWFVEVDKKNGDLSKPVKIESLTPKEAVIKSQLALFAQKCFTIDPKLSHQYLRECAQMASGRAVEQLRAFRVEHNVIERVRKGKDLREAITRTVDMNQKGVAFLYLSTKDIDLDGKEDERTYRLRLDYELHPPTNEDEVMKNPLGLFVTLFAPSLER